MQPGTLLNRDRGWRRSRLAPAVPFANRLADAMLKLLAATGRSALALRPGHQCWQYIDQVTKTGRLIILLVLGALGLVVAIALGELIRFLVVALLTASVFAIVLRESNRNRDQGRGERSKDP